MPCRGPSPEEWAAHLEYERKMKEDPEFAKKERERIAKDLFEWENGGKQKAEAEVRERMEKERKRKIDILNANIRSGELEKKAFEGFMAVFLCKAMELIVTNGLLRHVYSHMEWWWEEHRKRDNNDFSTPKEELYTRLLECKNLYRVT